MNWRGFFRRGRDLAAAGLIALAMILLIRNLPSGLPEEIAGFAFAVDGDSLEISGLPVRLSGIDAPELAQQCGKVARSWACGEAARRALQQHIAGRKVTCEPRARDKYDRYLAECFVAGENLNRWLVAQGWAVSFGAYMDLEQGARGKRIGLWAGEFERPVDWRVRHQR